MSEVRRSASSAAEADLAAGRGEYLFKVPLLSVWAERWLRDSRDLPVLHLYLDILLCTLPSAAAVCCWQSHALGLLHVAVNYVLFLERFLVALLHITEHRQLFRPGTLITAACLVQAAAWPTCLTQATVPAGCALLNWATPLLLAPFFGVPSGMYRLHHTVMHHVVRPGAAHLYIVAGHDDHVNALA